MAKLSAEDRQKAIAEANAKSKGGNTADLEKDGPTNEELDAPLSPEAQAEQDRIIAASEADANPDADIFSDQLAASDEAENDPRAATAQRHEAAIQKLRDIAVSYPNTTPNEHTVFGFSGRVFQLGDLRDLFGLPRR